MIAAEGAGWEQSELPNSTQGFYSLTGLQPGTRYRFLIESGGVTLWKDVIETKRPGTARRTPVLQLYTYTYTLLPLITYYNSLVALPYYLLLIFLL